MQRAKITPTGEARILERVREGLNCKETAESTGHSLSQVERVVKLHGGVRQIRGTDGG